jgi:hypothetical protein
MSFRATRNGIASFGHISNIILSSGSNGWPIFAVDNIVVEVEPELFYRFRMKCPQFKATTYTLGAQLALALDVAYTISELIVYCYKYPMCIVCLNTIVICMSNDATELNHILTCVERIIYGRTS